MKKFETERLILRKVTLQDTDDLYNNWGSDKITTKFLIFDTHESKDVTRKYIEYWIKRYDYDELVWAVQYKENNEVIGIISGKKKDDETIELGYSISSKYFNKGITTEALGSIIDYLFNELGYLTVEAIIPSLNVGSIKVAEKCLMKRKLILNGKYKDKDGNIQDLIVHSRSKR